ncbi:unnamed protein product [Adineta steineri]|uniref:Uncharacterized protein n=1 Tax=Adineta steineri TaxID=433720 RepID=A0A814S1D5_9BILA|nr:unnamed protein product [Adineta steineri]CAF1534386.1 unnamed protein product [Adineta steineri]CAF1654925.1 unnamed protein product [Adineta steineri]
MPQGKTKNKQLPANMKKKATNKVNPGKISKTVMHKKKKNIGGNGKTGLKAVQERLTTQIAKNIEQECASKVKSNEGKSLLIVNAN